MEVRPSGENNPLLQAQLRFLKEQRSHVENPPNDEPVIAAFHEASLFANGKFTAYRDLTNAYLAIEKIKTPSYQLSKYFKAHQAVIVGDPNRYDLGYPQRFTESSAWWELIAEQYSNIFTLYYDQLVENLLEVPMNTNRHTRQNVVRFVGGALMRRGREAPLTVHEYGSAGNLVLNAIALGRKDHTIIHDNDGIFDPNATMLFEGIAYNMQLGEGKGVEALPPKSEKDKIRLKGYTLDPSQLDGGTPKGLVETTFDLLSEVKPINISTVEANVFNIKPGSEQETALIEKPADLAVLSHVLSQNPGSTRKFIEAIRPFLAENAVVVVNEYAEIDEEDPRELKVLDHWYDAEGRCKTFVLEMTDEDRGFYPIIEWDTAHCRSGKFAPQIGRLIGDVTVKR